MSSDVYSRSAIMCLRTRRHARAQTRTRADTHARRHARTQTRTHADTHARAYVRSQTRTHADKLCIVSRRGVVSKDATAQQLCAMANADVSQESALCQDMSLCAMSLRTRGHARAQTRTRADTHARRHTRTQTRTHADTHARVYARTQTRTHADTPACRQARKQTRTHADTHAGTRGGIQARKGVEL